MYVDDILVIDAWTSGTSEYNATVTFATADLLYPIRLEYKEDTGAAYCFLRWNIGGGKVVVPSAVLFTAASAISGSPFSLTVS